MKKDNHFYGDYLCTVIEYLKKELDDRIEELKNLPKHKTGVFSRPETAVSLPTGQE